jgi:hypothetical protein
MNSESDTSGIDERRRADAYAAAGWRVAAVVFAWAVATVLRPAGADGVRLVTDLALAVGTWAVVSPAHRRGGPAFLRADHWTKIVAAPVMLGGVLAVFDLWRIFAPAP